MRTTILAPPKTNLLRIIREEVASYNRISIETGEGFVSTADTLPDTCLNDMYRKNELDAFSLGRYRFVQFTGASLVHGKN